MRAVSVGRRAMMLMRTSYEGGVASVSKPPRGETSTPPQQSSLEPSFEFDTSNKQSSSIDLLLMETEDVPQPGFS